MNPLVIAEVLHLDYLYDHVHFKGKLCIDLDEVIMHRASLFSIFNSPMRYTSNLTIF